MKKFAAHFVFPIISAPIKKGIVETDNEGRIIQLKNPGKQFQEESGLEFHNGIISPEFVIPTSPFNHEEFLNQFDIRYKQVSASTLDFQSSKTILNLIKRIQQNNESVALEILIKIFTLEMAKSNQLENNLGSIEPAKRPGLIVISAIDYKNMKLTEKSSLKKLI